MKCGIYMEILKPQESGTYMEDSSLWIWHQYITVIKVTQLSEIFLLIALSAMLCFCTTAMNYCCYTVYYCDSRYQNKMLLTTVKPV